MAEYVHPEVLVSTDWVAQHRNDPNVRIVESDEDILLYDVGHIPGAVKVDWQNELQHQVIRDYVDKDAFGKLIGGKGFKRIKRVTKVEDLMTILAVDDSDYIMIRPDDLEKIKDQFNLPLIKVDQSEATGFPMIAVRDGDKLVDPKSFGKLSKQTLTLFGFDGVQAVGGNR